MEPWYRVVTPRAEVREGRSFSPDEFAIALEQVVRGTAPADYTDPEQFFACTWTALYHPVRAGQYAAKFPGVADLLAAPR